MKEPDPDLYLDKARSLWLAPFTLEDVSLEEATAVISIQAHYADGDTDMNTLPGVPIVLFNLRTPAVATISLDWPFGGWLVAVLAEFCQQADLEIFYLRTGVVLSPKFPPPEAWHAPKPEDFLPGPPGEVGQN